MLEVTPIIETKTVEVSEEVTTGYAFSLTLEEVRILRSVIVHSDYRRERNGHCSVWTLSTLLKRLKALDIIADQRALHATSEDF